MKKISKTIQESRPFANQMFAFANHVHRFYPNTVADLTARDAIEGDLRYEGAIVYVVSDQTTYQLRGGSENTDWIALVSSSGAVSHTTLGDIGNNTHVQIDAHIADSSLHFTQASISITESQINDLQSYALASHDHDLTYLGISAAAASSNALESDTTTVDVSAADAPVAGQVLTATGPTAATWQAPSGGGGSGDVVQVGTQVDTRIAYFTADKNISGDDNFTWDDATSVFSVKGATPKMQIEDTDNVSNAMVGHIDFRSTAGIAAQIGFIQAGGIFEISNPTGDVKVDASLQVTGYLTGYGGVPTDGQHLIWNTSNSRAEFTTVASVTKSGTPVDNQIAVFNAENVIEGDANFTWNGTVFSVHDLGYDSATDKLTIGAGDLSGAGIEINASADGNPFINLQQAGTTRSIFKFNDTSDRTEISSTADNITLRPGNVDSYTFAQANLTVAGDITFTEGSVQNANYIQFDVTYVDGQSEGRLQWNSEDGALEVGLPGGNVNLQIGQEHVVRVRNITGSLIPNGSVLYTTGTSAGRPLVALAQADNVPQTLVVGMATEDIANNSNGYMTTQGLVRDIDTSALVAGQFFFLSETVAGGYQQNRPITGSGYAVSLGQVITSHATNGVVIFSSVIVPRLDRLSGVKFDNPEDGEFLKYVAANNQYEFTEIGLPDLDTDFSDTMHLVNGSALDSPAVTVTSDGATITLSMEKSGGGDIRFVFDDGVYTYDCTPAATIALTAGSDVSPQINYVYILASTKALTVSTSGWPGTEHAPIATVLCQSAASLQTDGAYKVHAWTDHVDTVGHQGHLAHLNSWIRSRPAGWISGVVLTPTAGAAQLDIATSSGIVLQLHDHVFPAFDTSTGSSIFVVNDPDAAYTKVSSLTQADGVDKDANGVALGGANTDHYNLVIWGVVNESAGDCKLMCNLPDGSYGTNIGDQATLDVDNTAIYSIPTEYIGTGFLIAFADRRSTWVFSEYFSWRSWRGYLFQIC
jgi:hypothetical protein